MVHGANKPFNVALIVPDAEAVGRWVRENGVRAGDVTNDERVRELIASEIKKHSGSFKELRAAGKFVLLSEDFTTDNGMLTPTLKLKRRSVLARYEKELRSALLAGRNDGPTEGLPAAGAREHRVARAQRSAPPVSR